MKFREEWISVGTLHELTRLVQAVEGVPGAVIEFGCWEGRSLIEIAQAAPQRPVLAVDHWQGNIEDEYTLGAIKERDVFATFLANTTDLDNVVVHQMSNEEFMATWHDPIAFLHLDADHRYQPVKDQIEWALPLLSPGAVMCGDDYSKRWPGVTQAVDEALPARQIINSMWVHRND